MSIAGIIIGISLFIGLVFNLLGVIGILRFPDVYTRLHADTKATTFGSIFIGLAVIIYGMVTYVSSGGGQFITLAIHAAVAVIVLAVTNATGAHAIARAAHKRGHKPVQAVVDHLVEKPAEAES